MKEAKTIEDVYRKRKARGHREQIELRTGKVTAPELQKRNSLISDKCVLKYNAKELAKALAQAK